MNAVYSSGPLPLQLIAGAAQMTRSTTDGDELFLRLYAELRGIADRLLKREAVGHTLQPTALLHEAWLKLSGERQPKAVDRSHYLALAARAMRQVLVDHARKRQAAKRGGDFVEVTLASVPGLQVFGWDTHQNNFESVKRLSEVLDTGWSTLMEDLKDKGLLDTTTVVWMGEFGRTPKINNNNGRDHWANSWSTVIGGGGIKGGQVIGKTSANPDTALALLKARLQNHVLPPEARGQWGWNTVDRYGTYADFLLDVGILQKKVNGADVFDGRFLADINKFDARAIERSAKGG